MVEAGEEEMKRWCKKCWKAEERPGKRGEDNCHASHGGWQSVHEAKENARNPVKGWKTIYICAHEKHKEHC